MTQILVRFIRWFGFSQKTKFSIAFEQEFVEIGRLGQRLLVGSA